ncbi:response regulator [Pyxidicoccus parkwayensis]|uniref:Response regulator n=1 Tax=Pyxidicoccus parkwayensis TaxID=2813578 RepID=A0ABX7P1P1_9BACT|nr:response regulator [Pyxidicoccus parkwaysis]QSQ23950.1 response regulator [Pyxidicoccus parkwaysis]
MHTVLLVDDDPSLLRLYTRVLENLGCTVATAPDGREALTMAPVLCPDLIITDVTMPKMDGLELCRALREDAALRGIPVIVHSALDAVVTPPGVAFLRKSGDLKEFGTQVIRSLSEARLARRLTPAA